MTNKKIKINSPGEKKEVGGKGRLKIKIQGEQIPQKKSKFRFSYVVLVPVLLLVISGLYLVFINTKKVESKPEEAPVPISEDFDYHRIMNDEDMLDALYELKVPRKQIPRVMLQFRNLIPPEDIVGSEIRLYKGTEESAQQSLIFTPEPPLYEIIIGFGDTSFIKRRDREMQKKVFRRSHVVTFDNILFSLDRDKFSLQFIYALEDMLAWSVDFSKIGANSKFRFKVLYEETYADSTLISTTLDAIQFEENGETQDLFRFGEEGIFDLEGRSARKQFLKAPVVYSRISSMFGKRINPITGHEQDHKGTDFAAPAGTPIRSLADGIIEIATYNDRNGNYIKIRHDDMYETQYLHMQNFAPNVVPGTSVSQGDIVGYVGSTGSSTGPHVCLRFWKYGEQVDFLHENIPQANLLGNEDLLEFIPVRDSLLSELDAITY